LWQALWIAAVASLRLRDGMSLERGLSQAGAQIGALLGSTLHPRAAAAAKDVAFTAARQRALTDALIARLASRPPPAPLHALLGVALAQLVVQRHAAYAVVDQAVRAARQDDATAGASGFVNAVLRNALRQFDPLLDEARRDDCVRFNLPRWWLDRLRHDHPDHWRRIVEVQRLPPPLVLRVNPLRGTRDEALARLRAAGVAAAAVGASGVRLEVPRAVDEIPGFAEGWFAVQDAGAQLAAPLLDVADGMRVLDACAAPGGKTAHLAALAAIDLVAVDSDAQRARRIEDNLARLGTHAGTRVHVCIDDVAAAAAAGRLPHQRYDRILLDAPCTASGIVRRHPDIPWLRRPEDIAQLATQQRRLLDALWPLLAPAGRLLYAVCSVFAEEGVAQIDAFIARHGDARLVPLPRSDGGAAATLMLLPADDAVAQAAQAPACELPAVRDGFFYALLEKSG
jgi:16S rRNA (cytosine967-C5)-methyltransferase